MNEISSFTLGFSQGQSHELERDALRAGSGTRCFFGGEVFVFRCHAAKNRGWLCRINNISTPQKSNIDTQNCHFSRESHFPNHHFGYPC